MIKIAIDTGGTFTDYTSVGRFKDQAYHKIFVKNPTNHQYPADGILAGLKKLAEEWDADLETFLKETEKITLGTTLALNALLEKKGVKTALFTTAGFRDALEIRRAQLKNQWDLAAEKPMVLVPRRLRLGIEGRMDYRGDIVAPLNEDKVREACRKCRELGVKAIAVCYLFSFLNPEHERRTAEIIKEELPDVFVSLSADVAPRIREYERTTTTVINAYLTPVLADYLNDIKKELALYGWQKPIHIMLNNGGLSDTEAMAAFAVKTLLSGPAGGAVGNETIGKLLGKTHTVLADMGGTSFDIHVISGSSNQLVPQTELAGYPLSIPMIDISSIGAGGGSIAHVEIGGRVFIGPDSAGSVPGPACYDLGGAEPTVTDALLILGLINEDNFLGGKFALSRERAEQAIKEKVADPLNLSVHEAARIIYGIAAEMMADAVRLVTTQKGNDPRIYSLISAGGAFPLFAAKIMESLHMPEILIPVQGPVFCSWGMLGASSRYDATRSFFMEKKQWNAKKINQTLALMMQEGESELERLSVDKDQRRFDLILEMRYVSQHHEISVPWKQGTFSPDSWETVEKEFYDTHEAIYEYAERDKDWEIIDLHLACYEENGENVLFPMASQKSNGRTKKVSGYAFNQEDEIVVPIYNEGDLNEVITGPALIDFDYTTLVIPEHFFCAPADEGILVLKKEVL
ncbi:hydantoinase/oxoprolinase family protein [Acetobacterium paludosum]|uniref:Hydantoinase/oxoprolinase family protein n=1 Tax=Acetobacterium paludosum TaxID=52693 RepID=A0A923KWR0_9FIRM|nr:hydantoinase/oxoprolinase family protein [Acetobacterium paludosum]MBC3888333.1 hydantoinase/oxoprolinase family protein [Acetobacterium paludosum]